MSRKVVRNNNQSESQVPKVSKERSFNFIYSQLVENESDLVGHIAYSLYKNQKISYIKTFKETNNRPPNEEDLEGFHMASEAVIIPNRIQAEQILQVFMDTVLKKEIEAIQSATIQNQQEILKDIVQPLKPHGFWKGIWLGVLQSLISAIILAIILFLLVFGTSVSENGFGPTIVNMFSSENTEQIKTNKPV